MNENETRTRTEREQYIENNHNLHIEGDPGTEQSVIISKTEQESHEQAVPEQENPVNEHSVIISKTEKEPEQEQEPQANPVESVTVVQDVSHCVTKTDIDN